MSLPLREVVAALLVAACGATANRRSPSTEELPPWLAYHQVDHGLKLTGTVAHASFQRQPTDSLAKPQRVVVSAVLDLSGVVREPTNDSREFSIVPFGSPVVDYAPTPTSWWARPYHSAIVAGGDLEIIGEGKRYVFANPEGATSIAAGCLARAETRDAIPCFGRLPLEGGPIVLEQDSAIGPLSRAEWSALKTTSREWLAGWERGGGPRDDRDVLQIAGSWGNTDDTWRGLHREALVCGVLVDHTVACWGTSRFYELGDGVRSSELRYARVPGLRDVAEVAVGPNFACARTLDRHVACWGDASKGAFPLPKHPDGAAIPGCVIDRDATERLYRTRLAEQRRAAEACRRRDCPPGALDCHLGCVVRDPPRERIYRRDATCTTSRVFARPERLDLDDVVSIGAGAAACFVFAKGHSSCGGG